eukprot:tig00000158_g10123.t2
MPPSRPSTSHDAAPFAVCAFPWPLHGHLTGTARRTRQLALLQLRGMGKGELWTCPALDNAHNLVKGDNLYIVLPRAIELDPDSRLQIHVSGLDGYPCEARVPLLDEHGKCVERMPIADRLQWSLCLLEGDDLDPKSGVKKSLRREIGPLEADGHAVLVLSIPSSILDDSSLRDAVRARVHAYPA